MSSIGDLEKRIAELEEKWSERFNNLKLMVSSGMAEGATVNDQHEKLLEKLTRAVLDGGNGSDSLLTKTRLSEEDRKSLWEELRRLQKINELRAEDEKESKKESRSHQIALVVAVIGGLCGIVAAAIMAAGAIFGNGAMP